jgi:hypothetical protein
VHHIQDFILAAGSLVFAVALIPTVLSTQKPALSTSVSTSLVLYVFAGVYISLRLWFAAATTFVTGILWTILAVQKYRQSKR